MRRTFKKLRSLVLSAAIIPMIFATPAHAISVSYTHLTLPTILLV